MQAVDLTKGELELFAMGLKMMLFCCKCFIFVMLDITELESKGYRPI